MNTLTILASSQWQMSPNFCTAPRHTSLRRYRAASSTRRWFVSHLCRAILHLGHFGVPIVRIHPLLIRRSRGFQLFGAFARYFFVGE